MLTDDKLETPQTPAGTETPKPLTGNEGNTVSEAQYQGLQKQYQKLFDEHKTKVTELSQLGGQVAELQTQLTSTQANQASFIKDLETTKANLGERDTTIQGLQSELSRWKLVQSEFPDLVSVAHLVPTGDEEAMRTALKELGGMVTRLTEEKMRVAMAGVTPPAGGGRAQPAMLSLEELGKKLEETAGTPAYAQWGDMWSKRVQEEQKKG